MRAGSAVTPTGAKKPSRISGWPNVARSLARSTSAIIASSNPAPSAAPSTAITMGSSLCTEHAEQAAERGDHLGRLLGPVFADVGAGGECAPIRVDRDARERAVVLRTLERRP